MVDKNNVDIDKSNNLKSGEQALGTSVANKSKRHVGRIIFRIVVIVLVALIVICVCGFSIYRWLWGNDSLDIRGTWYIEGSDIPIEITEDHIVLNDEVAYFYVIDSESKTITYTLGDLEGSGFYRFSADRNQIAIMDGTFNWWTTLISDIPWTAEAFASFIGGEDKSPAGENNVTLLSRNGFSASDSDLPDQVNLDMQSENPEGTITRDNEDIEGESDFEDAADPVEVDFSDDSLDQNDQADHQVQDDQSDTDSSNDEDSHGEFDTFDIYDR